MIFEMDKTILLWIKDNVRRDWLTPIMKGITSLGNAGAFWIVMVLLLLLYKPTRKLGFICLAALVEEFLVNDLIIKELVKRIRPYEKIVGLDPLIPKPSGYSFPSGHATSSFAVGYTIFRKGDKRLGIPMLILAIVISFSRLYVAVHYPTDIMAGVAIGILFSYLGEYTVKKIDQYWSKNRSKQ